MYTYQDGLNSARLSTRFLTESDIASLTPFFEDEEAPKFIPFYDFPTPALRARYMIEKQIWRYSEQRYGLQALIRKEDQVFVGMCGLLLQDVDGKQEVEIGYHLLPQFWNKGYASEAARLFKHYAFSENKSPSIISIIDINNVRSHRVAEANGMTRDRFMRWNDWDVVIYRTPLEVPKTP